MVPVQVRVTKKILNKINEEVDNGNYANRSEIIREAIRRHLERSEKLRIE